MLSPDLFKLEHPRSGQVGKGDTVVHNCSKQIRQLIWPGAKVLQAELHQHRSHKREKIKIQGRAALCSWFVVMLGLEAWSSNEPI